MTSWKEIDPVAYRQGWDAALAGKPRESCDFSGTGPRAAWSEGYDAAKDDAPSSGDATSPAPLNHDQPS